MSELISPIETLKEGLRFCENYIKSEECSEEQKVIKAKQIKDHRTAIEMLQKANGVTTGEKQCDLPVVVQQRESFKAFLRVLEEVDNDNATITDEDAFIDEFLKSL